MATAVQVTHVPVEVYLNSSYEPDSEYVNGRIEERPMGEWNHADWRQRFSISSAGGAMSGISEPPRS
ncbi:MAG: hypothetical protein ABSC48_01265 [Terracidiphilus sp.]|jgi:hypothetical protein